MESIVSVVFILGLVAVSGSGILLTMEPQEVVGPVAWEDGLISYNGTVAPVIWVPNPPGDYTIRVGDREATTNATRVILPCPSTDVPVTLVYDDKTHGSRTVTPCPDRTTNDDTAEDPMGADEPSTDYANWSCLDLSLSRLTNPNVSDALCQIVASIKPTDEMLT